MKGLNIDQAIAHFNAVNNNKIVSGKLERMTRVRLAVKLWPDVSRETACQYLSASTIYEEAKFSTAQVRQLCKELGVDSNFIFGIKQMKGILS